MWPYLSDVKGGRLRHTLWGYTASLALTDSCNFTCARGHLLSHPTNGQVDPQLFEGVIFFILSPPGACQICLSSLYFSFLNFFLALCVVKLLTNFLSSSLLSRNTSLYFQALEHFLFYISISEPIFWALLCSLEKLLSIFKTLRHPLELFYPL